MERHIGIIGAGVAGLHLGLYLRLHGVDATVITDRKPAEIANMRLQNTVAHHSITVEREKTLGINHWPDPDLYYGCHHHSFETPQPLRFRGDFSKPGRAVDYRVYLPKLMEDFESHGGRIEYRNLTADDVPGLASRFDLVVVSSGKGALGQMFQHDGAQSPFDHPLRLLCVGLYTGVRKSQPNGVTLSVSPGHGELIEIPTLTFGGHSTALLLENVPGGDLEELVRFRADDDPKGFLKLLLAKLEKHHPTIYDRIDTATFGLCQPQDLLQGSVVPTVRKTKVDLGDGKIAVAAGDVHCVVDPAMGQGANIASFSAVTPGRGNREGRGVRRSLRRAGRSPTRGTRARGVALDELHADAADAGAFRAHRRDGRQSKALQRVHDELQLSGTAVGAFGIARANQRLDCGIESCRCCLNASAKQKNAGLRAGVFARLKMKDLK